MVRACADLTELEPRLSLGGLAGERPLSHGRRGGVGRVGRCGGVPSNKSVSVKVDIYRLQEVRECVRTCMYIVTLVRTSLYELLYTSSLRVIGSTQLQWSLEWAPLTASPASVTDVGEYAVSWPNG